MCSGDGDLCKKEKKKNPKPSGDHRIILIILMFVIDVITYCILKIVH